LALLMVYPATNFDADTGRKMAEVAVELGLGPGPNGQNPPQAKPVMLSPDEMAVGYWSVPLTNLGPLGQATEWVAATRARGEVLLVVSVEPLSAPTNPSETTRWILAHGGSWGMAPVEERPV
jgi:hypothetical protein